MSQRSDIVHLSGLWHLLRAQEWWNYKIPVALAAAYAAAWTGNVPFSLLLLPTLLITAGGFSAAVFASVFNDFMDIDQDRLAGKTTLVMKLGGRKRLALLVASLGMQLFIWNALSAMPLSCTTFLLIWAAYTAYSLPPIRLKERDAAGAFCIAIGEHLLAALFSVFVVVETTGCQLSLPWLSALSLWSLCFGMRGILWHQLNDIENDRRSGCTTMGALRGVDALKAFGERYLFPLEATSFLCLLTFSHNAFAWAALAVYGLLEWLRYRVMNANIIIVAPKPHARFVLFEYYQIFFPLVFLLSAVSVDKSAVFLVALFCTMFAAPIALSIHHVIHMAKLRFRRARAGAVAAVQQEIAEDKQDVAAQQSPIAKSAGNSCSKIQPIEKVIWLDKPLVDAQAQQDCGKRQITWSAETNKELLYDGFSILDFLKPAEIDHLRKVVRGLSASVARDDVHIPTPFRISAFHNDADYKTALFNEIYSYLQDRVDKLLVDYIPLVVNVFEKDPGSPNSAVSIHQNPSFVEEPFYQSVSIWIPLLDAKKENGTVGVLRGSQDAFDTMRAANMPDVFSKLAHKLTTEYFEPLQVNKGQCAVLHDSTVHWSYPNLSNDVRTAIQLIMVPKEARHIYYYYNTDGEFPRIDMYSVSKDFFFNFNCKEQPAGLQYLGSRPFEYRLFSEEEVLSTLSAKHEYWSQRQVCQVTR